MSRRQRDSSSSRSSTWSQQSRSTTRSRSPSSSPRDRDYRTRTRHSRSPRDRDYRERDQSRERSRSRDRRRHSRGRRDYSPVATSRKRERERSRSPFFRRRSPGETKPSNKVILTSLPDDTDKDVLNILLARQGFHPIDIRVVRRNTDSGAIRIFGFVEFSDVKTAEDWINHNDGYLKMDDGYQVRLEYSREESSSRERPVYNPLTTDWTCSKCTINNFNRRTSCFKCGTTRKDSDALEAKGYGMVGVQPSDTLLIRELPSTVSEDSIRRALSGYSGLTIQRIQLARSGLYAFAQMKSAEEAGYMLQTFNKIVPYVENCAVIITYSRQSLNQILIKENVNLLKTQSGISSASIQEDPTNSAAQLAQNAIRLAQMGKAVPGGVPPIVHMEAGPARQSISTPFGYLPTYATPDPNSLQMEPSSGYHWDRNTGFYFDSKTGYYYNPNTANWMFWSSKFSTYINCEGGDLEQKRQMQEEERKAQQLSQSAVISAPPSAAVDVDKEQQLRLDAQALAATSSTSSDQQQQTPVENSGETEKKRRKKQQQNEEEQRDSNKPKTPQEIQKEMQRWARRQEKIKMSFKQTANAEAEGGGHKDEKTPTGRKESVAGRAKDATPSHSVEAIKKPWDDDDDDEETEGAAPPPPDAVLPGRMRTLTNRQARVRIGRAGLMTESTTSEEHQVAADEAQPHHRKPEADQLVFDQDKYIDRAKNACLLCKRQFPNADTLAKHCQLSNLHKTNVAEKIRELKSAAAAATGNGDSRERTQMQQYRDRARERRQQHGYDPGLSGESRAGGRDHERDEHAHIEMTAMVKAAVPLDESNIGNKMLKSMGWSEGKGLGRNLQGIKDPIRAEQHVQGVGLGASGSRRQDANVPWKERNRAAAIQRFRDLEDQQQQQR